MGGFQNFLLNEDAGKVDSEDIKEYFDVSEDPREFKTEDAFEEYYFDFTKTIFDNLFGEGSSNPNDKGNENLTDLLDKMKEVLNSKEYLKERNALHDKWSKIIAEKLNKFGIENKDQITRTKLG
jgi:hypothetical protein